MQVRRAGGLAARSPRSSTARPRKDLARRYATAREHDRRPRGRARDRDRPQRARHRRGDDGAAARCPDERAAACPGASAIPARWLACWSLLARSSRSALRCSAGRAHRGTGVAPGARPRATVRTAVVARPARGARLQPVRHRPGKPRPDRQRRRQRPDHDLDHRELLRRQPAQGRRHRARRVPRRRAGRRRAGDRDPDADAGLRGAGLRRRHDRRSLPFGDSGSLAARGWKARSGRARHVHDGERIPCTRRRTRHRYYLMWMTTLPPDSSRRRSPTSRCSAGTPAGGQSSRSCAARPPRDARARAGRAGRRAPGRARRVACQQLRVDARRREAGHRVQLVEQHLARRRRRSRRAPARRSPTARNARRASCAERARARRRRSAPGPAAPCRRACTSPRSRRTRPGRTISPGSEAPRRTLACRLLEHPALDLEPPAPRASTIASSSCSNAPLERRGQLSRRRRP